MRTFNLLSCRGVFTGFLWALLAMAGQAQAQSCPLGSTFALNAFDNQSPSTVINNQVFVGNARVNYTLATTGSATITTNTIDDGHLVGTVGIRLGHSGSADSTSDTIVQTFNFREPNNAGVFRPVSQLTFSMLDIDLGDNVIVDAFNENGTLISLSTAIYSFDSSSGATVVTYNGGNRFSSSGSSDNNNRGTINFNFGANQVRTLRITYYDTNSAGSYTLARLNACNAGLRLFKTTPTITGGPFGFTLTNTSRNTGATVTTSAINTPTEVDGNAGVAGVQPFVITNPAVNLTINESSLPADWLLRGASCLNETGATVGSLSGTTYTVPASSMYFGTLITCTFTNSPTTADLAVTKTNTPSSGNVDLPGDTVTRGQLTTYQIVVTNNGPDQVTGATLVDSSSGLTCSGVGTGLTCASSSGTTCPATLPTAQAFAAGTPVTLGLLTLGGTVTFNLTCRVPN